MAPEDSRWQDLTNMQNSANSATSPGEGQPTGQFSGDDIEFESFMFDQGTGPLTPQLLNVDAGVNMQSSQNAAPTATEAAPVEITGQNVPVPSYLRGPEAPSPSRRPSQPLRPLTGPLATRSTGPLGANTANNNTSTNLGARLLQVPQGASGETQHPSGSLPDLESLRPRGTGPLGTGALSSAKPVDYAGQNAEGIAAAAQGPINPSYFKTPTGPLGARQGTGPLGRRSTLDATSTSTLPGIQQLYKGTGPLNQAQLLPTSEPATTQSSSWSDYELASVEDFSRILLEMLNSPAPTAGYNPGSASSTGTITPLREAIQGFDRGYGASSMPHLEEAPSFSEPISPVEEALGWGTMTGAPTESDYEAAVRISSPLYSGPELSRVVPLEEAQAYDQLAAVEPALAQRAPEAPAAPTASASMPPATEVEPEQGQTEESGKFNPDELEFESFMFNTGLGSTQVAETTGPPLPHMDSFMPAVTGMEAAFEAPPPFAAPQAEEAVIEPETAPAQESRLEAVAPAGAPAGYAATPGTYEAYGEVEQQAEPQQIMPEATQLAYAEPEQRVAPVEQREPATDTQQPEQFAQVEMEQPEPLTMQAEQPDQAYAAADEVEPEPEQGQPAQQGPLPFWLQDTSDLEVTARQGHINVPGLSSTQEPEAGPEPAIQYEAPAPAAMQATPAEKPVQLAVEPPAELLSEPPAAVPVEQPEETQPQQALETMAPAMEPAVEAQAPIEQEAAPEPEPLLAYAVVNDTPEVDVDAYDIDLAMPDMTFPEMVAPRSAEAAGDGQELGQFPDYEDLPPIEPFDFGALNLPNEEESLGFNTEELSGMMPSRHDPMRATADLDVLSDIFDGAPVNALDAPSFLATSPVGAMDIPRAQDYTDYIETQEFAPEHAAGGQPVMDIAATDQYAQPAQQEAPQPQQTTPSQTPFSAGKSQGGWTSIVTSHLNADALDDIDSLDTGRLSMPPAASIAPAPPPARNKPIQPAASAIPAADEEPGVDIQPFDFTQLNLERDEELPTEALGSGRRNPANNTAALGTNQAASAWGDEELGEDDEDDEDTAGGEHDTSLFMLTQPRLVDGSPRSTRWLTEDVLQDAAGRQTPSTSGRSRPAAVEPAATRQEDQVQTSSQPTENAQESAQPGSDVVKARVAWTGSTNLPDQDADDYLDATTPAQPAATQAEAAPASPETSSEYREEPQPAAAQQWQQAPQAQEPPVAAPTPHAEPPALPAYQYQPMQAAPAPEPQPQPQPQFEMPKVGAVRDIFTSGPLPELEGFDQLRQLVDNNPDDIGAHMALASAYSQLGDNDTAVRVYRRILRKRNVSATFLRLITEELNDFEGEMQGNAHYHQVRGDLYTRTGRNYEAIQEYNKIV